VCVINLAITPIAMPKSERISKSLGFADWHASRRKNLPTSIVPWLIRRCGLSSDLIHSRRHVICRCIHIRCRRILRRQHVRLRKVEVRVVENVPSAVRHNASASEMSGKDEVVVVPWGSLGFPKNATSVGPKQSTEKLLRPTVQDVGSPR
jgi:hypothetical protein